MCGMEHAFARKRWSLGGGGGEAVHILEEGKAGNEMVKHYRQMVDI